MSCSLLIGCDDNDVGPVRAVGGGDALVEGGQVGIGLVGDRVAEIVEAVLNPGDDGVEGVVFACVAAEGQGVGAPFVERVESVDGLLLLAFHQSPPVCPNVSGAVRRSPRTMTRPPF